MKYKFKVNQLKGRYSYIIIGTIICASHIITGFGFIGFSILLISIIDCTEIKSSNNTKNMNGDDERW